MPSADMTAVPPTPAPSREPPTTEAGRAFIEGRLPRHPGEHVAPYRASGAWSTETTIEQFWHSVAQWPDREAVCGLDLRLTYRELDERSDKIATALHRAGLQPLDRVLMQVGNSAEAVVCWYALLKAGAIPVATLAAHRAHEISTIGSMLQARGHLVDSTVSDGFLIDFALGQAAQSATTELLWQVGPPVRSEGDGPELPRLLEAGSDIGAAQARATVQQIQDGLDPEGVAVFQLSGGTTGTPKVIPRLHAEYWNNARFNSRVLERDEHSRIAHVMPFIHNAGMVHAVFGAHAVGGCAVLLPFSLGGTALPQLIGAGVNDMMIVGPMLSWLDHDLWDDFAAQLQVMIYSGSKCPEHVFDRVTAQGVWVGQVWGMAEGPYTTTPRRAPVAARKYSVGQPVNPQDEYRIADLSGAGEAAVGDVGPLTYRGPSTLAGYFDAAEHNRRAIDAEGFVDTGDLAKITMYDGIPYLSFEGRVKDVISRGGEKISVEEVEKILLQHPSVFEVAVVAMPDEWMGDRACAFVSLVPGTGPFTLTDLQAHFERLGLAKFKWPERLEVVPALPRNHTFKIDRGRLRHTIAATLDQERGHSTARQEPSA